MKDKKCNSPLLKCMGCLVLCYGKMDVVKLKLLRITFKYFDKILFEFLLSIVDEIPNKHKG